MGVRSFESDIRVGEEFEKIVEMYLSCTHQVYQTTGNFKFFDLICLECFETFECKYDLIFCKTYNFCFEEPTLEHTIANKIIYGYESSESINQAFVFNTEDIRRWIKENLDKVLVKYGGDFNYRLYLINKQYLKSIPHTMMSLI